MKTASLPRTLATVLSHADAIAFVGDSRNHAELCATGRIDRRDGDAFQNAVVRLLENPYSPEMGKFSTHWVWCCLAAKKTTRAEHNPNGITAAMGGVLALDGMRSRGSDGSTDNAKSAYLGRFDPLPTEKREDINAKIRAVWGKLSSRQKKYLVAKARGMNNAEIGRKFGISAGSVAQIAEYIRAQAGIGEVTR